MNRKASFATLAGVSALALIAMGVAALPLVSANASPSAAAVGKTVDNFMLIDQTGISWALRYDKTAPAIVLINYVNGDKASRAAAKSAQALKAKYPAVEFALIDSNKTDSREAIVSEAKAQGITLPLLDDEFQLVGDSLGSTMTGEAYLIDPKTWTVLYHGPVDAAGAATKAKGYLGEALAAKIAGQPIALSEIAVKGTPIAFPDRAKKAEWSKISYVKDVAPILMKNCVDCHEPGGIAPWQMTSYDVVKGFGPMIRETLRTDRMPPFDVDRHVNAYQNDENLSEADTKTLIHWIEAGAPRGEGDDPLKVSVTARPEWPLGKPDLVVDIPSYTIPAAGVVDYQVPVVASPLTEGRWLKATTFKAGQRKGVHHILAGWIPKMPAAGEHKGFDWDISMGGYAVGSESNLAPQGWATWIPPGGAINFQMHYTPFGKASTDASKIGFYFLEKGKEPDLVKRQIIIADPTITIAPGEARAHERAYVQFPAAVQLFAAQPHAHYRGYASKLTAVYPDGTQKVVLNMPKYDFNWQREYVFKKLIDLPAGTKLVADYWYDNSVNNPANPDPKKLVEWGDQSTEEMLFTGIQFRWADETAKNRRDDLQKQLEQSSIYTAIDDNLDGVLQKAELKSSMLAPLQEHFADFDQNHDGALDPKEFGNAMETLQKAAAAQRAKLQQEHHEENAKANPPTSSR